MWSSTTLKRSAGLPRSTTKLNSSFSSASSSSNSGEWSDGVLSEVNPEGAGLRMLVRRLTFSATARTV